MLLATNMWLVMVLLLLDSRRKQLYTMFANFRIDILLKQQKAYIKNSSFSGNVPDIILTL